MSLFFRFKAFKRRPSKTLKFNTFYKLKIMFLIDKGNLIGIRWHCYLLQFITCKPY